MNGGKVIGKYIICSNNNNCWDVYSYFYNPIWQLKDGNILYLDQGHVDLTPLNFIVFFRRMWTSVRDIVRIRWCRSLCIVFALLYTVGCVCVCLVTQLCLTLFDPVDWPARLLCQWNSPGKNTIVVMASSKGSSQPRNWSRVSYISCIGRQGLYN